MKLPQLLASRFLHILLQCDSKVLTFSLQFFNDVFFTLVFLSLNIEFGLNMLFQPVRFLFQLSSSHLSLYKEEETADNPYIQADDERPQQEISDAELGVDTPSGPETPREQVYMGGSRSGASNADWQRLMTETAQRAMRSYDEQPQTNATPQQDFARITQRWAQGEITGQELDERLNAITGLSRGVVTV